MGMVLVWVGGQSHQCFRRMPTYRCAYIGWYDPVYDEELGSEPCIFTSVTPVCLCDYQHWRAGIQWWTSIGLE